MRNVIKFSLAASVILIASVALAATESEITKAPFYSSFDEAQASSAAMERPMLIDFYTDW